MEDEANAVQMEPVEIIERKRRKDLEHKKLSDLTDEDISFRDEDIELKGMKIHTRVMDPAQLREQNDARESGPLIVFVHGFLSCLETWRSIQKSITLKMNVRSVAFDRPGFGKSDKPDRYSYMSSHDGTDPYVYRFSADVLGELITHYKGNSVLLVSHSAGAIVASMYALDHAQSVLGQLFIAPSLVFNAPPSYTTYVRIPAWLGKNALWLASKFLPASSLVDRLYVHPENVDAAVIDTYRGLTTEEDWNRALWDFTQASLDSPPPDDLIARLRAQTCEYLIVLGDCDGVVEKEQCDEWAKEINAKVQMIFDSAHLPHEESPERVISAVQPYIRRMKKMMQ